MARPNIEIRSQAPFDFALTLGYFRRRAGELVDATEGDRYRRLLAIDGSRVLVEVRATGTVEAPCLSIECLAGDSAALPSAAAAIRSAFGLNDQLDALREALAEDVILTNLLLRLDGLRLVRTQSPFEALVWAIIGQQINLTFAFRLKSTLVRDLGDSLEFEGRTYWTFPEPRGLAGADEDALAGTGLGRRKAATLVSIARAIEAGDLDLESLATMPRADAEARLTALAGVGPWTAHYMLLRGLGDLGAFPASDLGLRAAAGRLYCDGEMAPMARMRELAKRWGDWRGYAAFYLWNSFADRAG